MGEAIPILLLLLGFSAFFSGSETALMALNKLRLRHLAETKPIRARLVERILRKPERLIGTILLGNNLVISQRFLCSGPPIMGLNCQYQT